MKQYHMLLVDMYVCSGKQKSVTHDQRQASGHLWGSEDGSGKELRVRTSPVSDIFYFFNNNNKQVLIRYSKMVTSV